MQQGVHTDAKCDIQQCWELLANNVASVCTDKLYVMNQISCRYNSKDSKGLFTWCGGPRSSGVGFFCFHALEDTKQKKLTPLDRGPPLHVNRV